MPIDVARLRNLFHLGVFSLLLPLMAIIDSGHRIAWLSATGLFLVGTVAAIGYLLATTNGLRKRVDEASVDSTTGLMNADALVRVIDNPLRQNSHGAVAVFDINNFYQLTQTIGHEQGEQVLQVVADRIVERTRGRDHAARVGPDRFAVLLEGVTEELTAAEVTTRLLGHFFEPASVGGLELDVSASAGISLIPAGLDGVEALRRAGLALDAAKRSALPIEIFRSEHDRRTADSLAMISQVQLGLERNEFDAHLQPIVDNWNGRTIGFEALVRWNHPERGVVPPSLFLHQIENLPVGRDFTNYMLRRSIQNLAALGNRDVGLSVNVSARDVEDLNLPLTIRALLEEFGVSPRRLTLEVPETVATRRRDRTEQVLKQVRDLGCGVAIDDFGTSSVPMDFLAALPVTELKIASRFTASCVDDSTARTVIRHIVGLAHGAGLRATAKGVERQAVLESLVDLGCDASQGYHFARPMSVEVADVWLENDRVFV